MKRLMVGIVLLLLPALTRGQEQEPVRTIPFDGPEIICHVLHNEGAVPLLTAGDAGDDPRNTLLIVLGNPKGVVEIERATGGLDLFLRAGGNLLLATDYPFTLRRLGVSIPGDRVTCPQDKGFRGLVDCPFLPMNLNENRGAIERDHPIFHFLTRGLATNCPSHILSVNNRNDLDDLLGFPPVARGNRRTYIMGSAKNADPNGRSLFIAGHGIFMNGMMLQPDTDNFNFATNAVRWLRDRPDGTARPNVLLMVDGTIITDFDMKLTPPLPPIPIPTLRMLNQLARGLEQERIPQRIFTEILGEQLRRFIGILAAIATIVLLVYGTRKMVAGRESTDIGKGPTVNATTSAITGVALDRQRRQALLRGWDFADEAKRLASDWLRDFFAVEPESWTEGTQTEMQVSAGYWAQRQLQRDGEWILQLARGNDPPRMRRADFQRFLRALQDLAIAADDGRVVLLVDGKNVRQT